MFYKSPFQFPLQNGWPCAPYEGCILGIIKVSKWGCALHFVPKTWETHFKLFQRFGSWKTFQNENSFCSSEGNMLKTCQNPNSFCTKASCPSDNDMLKIQSHFVPKKPFISLLEFARKTWVHFHARYPEPKKEHVNTCKNQYSFCSAGVFPSSSLMIKHVKPKLIL